MKSRTLPGSTVKPTQEAAERARRTYQRLTNSTDTPPQACLDAIVYSTMTLGYKAETVDALVAAYLKNYPRP